MEGLDISDPMLSRARERRPDLTLHHCDMTRFDLESRFDAVLCLNSTLALVGSHELMVATIQCAARHLNPSGPGVLILDLPNHMVEIPAENGRSSTERFVNDDCEGEQLEVKFESNHLGDLWVTEWTGTVDNWETVLFREQFAELVFDVARVEQEFERCGFLVEALLGSRDGEPFNEEHSWRRLYVLRQQA
eukprot:TRINITY_DN486_c0_g1_i1.p1 TRINITY_DN486_c0_g1~~TRINITY_DN486_c0_g1_i1.p1  ORF type:complete len:191 (+),score=20.05 TRINITY_DN486_c0_g1_i1:501-1073(+)